MTELNFASLRRVMVTNQLRTSGVNDPVVMAAMGAVPRERFVPAGRRAFAYADTAIPIGEGRFLNPPAIVGRLLTAAAPIAGERALVVGAATGYAAAVLAEIGLLVRALEEARTDGMIAANGVTPAIGPLADGWAAGAPYDLILIDGAIEQVPDALVAQLDENGRLVTGLAEEGVTRLAIGRRGGTGFGLATIADMAVAPLPGFARPRAFRF